MQNKDKGIKILEAVVVANKMDKTVKVTVEVPMKHPVYRKTIYRRKSYLAHAEGQHEIGEVVKIAPSRPYSKNVRWVVVK